MTVLFTGLDEKQKAFFQGKLTGQNLIFLDSNITPENIPQNLDAEVLSIFVKDKISKEVIEAMPNLRLIAVRSTGFDNVDTDFAKQKNIVVSNVPAYGSHTVAEFTFGLMLNLTRHITKAVNKVKVNQKFSTQGLQGIDLFGKTLGVVGTGKIGANVCKIARGFSMNILAFDAFPNEDLSKELEFKYVSLEELLQNSDIVTLHTPLNDQTRHLINSQNLSQIKKGALIVNTSRGEVIETQALLDALNSGQISGAALDVLESEDNLTKEDRELIENPKVLVTPHTAFNTVEAGQNIVDTTLDNIQSFINGSTKNQVN